MSSSEPCQGRQLTDCEKQELSEVHTYTSWTSTFKRHILYEKVRIGIDFACVQHDSKVFSELKSIFRSKSMGNQCVYIQNKQNNQDPLLHVCVCVKA